MKVQGLDSVSAGEGVSTEFRLVASSAERTEYNPVHAASRIVTDKAQDGSTAANLNIVRMRADTEDRERTILFQIQFQIDHELRARSYLRLERMKRVNAL